MNLFEVTRDTVGNGYRWTVTVGGRRGNLGLLRADGSGLTGVDPRVDVVEKTAGSADLFPGDYSFEVQSVYLEVLGSWDTDSRLVLSYEGHETVPMDFVGAYAANKEAGLASLLTAALELRSGIPQGVAPNSTGPDLIRALDGLVADEVVAYRSSTARSKQARPLTHIVTSDSKAIPGVIMAAIWMRMPSHFHSAANSERSTTLSSSGCASMKGRKKALSARLGRSSRPSPQAKSSA